MSRLVWVVAGFVLGVMAAGNRSSVPAPVFGAVMVSCAAAAALTWWAGSRDKASAVATAVATAIAAARAEAEAVAAAQAQAAAYGGSVNVYLPDGTVRAARLLEEPGEAGARQAEPSARLAGQSDQIEAPALLGGVLRSEVAH